VEGCAGQRLPAQIPFKILDTDGRLAVPTHAVKPMRILHVVDTFHLGGSEESTTQLAAEIVARGHDCFVAAVHRPREEDAVGRNQKDRLTRAGIGHAELGCPSTRVNLFYSPLRLRGLIRRYRPDVVHSHTEIPDLTVSLARRLSTFAVVRTMHNTVLWRYHRPFGRICESAFGDDFVVAVSEDALDAYRALRQRYSLPPSPCQAVVPLGIPRVGEDDLFDRSYLATRFGADTGKTLFCFAGRFEEQKGFDVLMAAIERLGEDRARGLELHAFGNGSALPECVARATRRKSPIFFHEPFEEISRLFRAFDAVVMPSRWEGFGRVSVEALAVGTPVIATDIPGLREALPPGWPLTFPDEDCDALRDLMAGFLTHEHETDRLRREALAWTRDKFSVDREADAYVAIYRQVTRASPGGTAD